MCHMKLISFNDRQNTGGVRNRLALVPLPEWWRPTAQWWLITYRNIGDQQPLKKINFEESRPELCESFCSRLEQGSLFNSNLCIKDIQHFSDMGRERQKKKNRSSTSKVKAARGGRTKTGRKKVNFLGSEIIAKNWLGD